MLIRIFDGIHEDTLTVEQSLAAHQVSFEPRDDEFVDMGLMLSQSMAATTDKNQFVRMTQLVKLLRHCDGLSKRRTIVGGAMK